MGLDLVVGLYGQAVAWAEPGDVFYQHLDEQFAAINAALKAAGLPEHHEPRGAAGGVAPWDCRVGRYAELHFLRRLAAHLGGGNILPPPLTDDDPTQDPILQLRYSQELADRPFEHLIRHGDAEGYYVPVDFPVPLLSEDAEGTVIGSTQRLHEECVRLRDALEIPAGMTVEDDEETFADTDEQQPWQRYPTETYTCLALLKACEVSLATGCVVAFC